MGVFTLASVAALCGPEATAALSLAVSSRLLRRRRPLAVLVCALCLFAEEAAVCAVCLRKKRVRTASFQSRAACGTVAAGRRKRLEKCVSLASAVRVCP